MVRCRIGRKIVLISHMDGLIVLLNVFSVSAQLIVELISPNKQGDAKSTM